MRRQSETILGDKSYCMVTAFTLAPSISVSATGQFRLSSTRRGILASNSLVAHIEKPTFFSMKGLNRTSESQTVCGQGELVAEYACNLWQSSAALRFGVRAFPSVIGH
ncbi:MAG: hypothetical protein ACI9ND_002158 [Yoonia sp.]|jgi:hypothetical protein